MSDLHDTAAGPSTVESWRMFDRIAGRYDLLNRLLSGGTDISWRKELVRHLPERQGLRILDLATGTCDVILTAAEMIPDRLGQSTAMDPSWGMLSLGWDKVRRHSAGGEIGAVRGDAMAIPAADESYDAVTIAFGIRNVPDVPLALKEMTRVLKPGGRMLILEFSLPSNMLFRNVYLFYFRNILPRIGALISGDSYAYGYLNQTVESFPYGEAFLSLMKDAGMVETRAFPLTFGIASIYEGQKPGEVE